jgi:hypothetical protein
MGTRKRENIRMCKKYRVINRGSHSSLQTLTWEDVNLPLDAIKNWEFEEVIDINSHWISNKNDVVSYINEEFTGVFEGVLHDDDGYNRFHRDDKEKVECLSLEFKIKSVLVNWRRLHDNVELDWEIGTHWKDKKWHIFYGIDKICFNFNEHFIESGFGHFSSKEKAEQFYQYMKEDIDKYFKMRKELKF